MSLHLSKCHINGNHMSLLIWIVLSTNLKHKIFFQAMFQQDLLITGHPKMLQKCSYLDKDDSVTPLMKCHYRCECSGDECQYLAIIMAHKEPSPAEPYQLCEITISK